MKKTLILFVAMVCGFSTLSTYRDPTYELLEKQDYELMQQDATQGPALSGPLNQSPYWASYDQWLCLPTHDIEITCMTADYDGIKKVPAIHITEASHYFEISMDPDPTPDCEKITERWRSLFENERTFCAYAAPLQELDIKAYGVRADSGSLWIINQLKTAKGYWDFRSAENWLQDVNDDESVGDDLDARNSDPES